MPRIRPLAALLAAALLATLPGTLPAQRIPLPHGAGSLTPDAAWTVLHGALLDAAERPTDPRDEPARTMLHALLAELRTRQRTGEHVVLHAAGPAGALRFVNAYTADGRATAAELRKPEAATRLREVLEPALRAGGAEVTFLGSVDPELFAVGSLRLRFQLVAGDVTTLLDHHVVPAGSRIAYFETGRRQDDAEAAAALEALLRTYDGAGEPLDDPMLRNMMFGALLGGAAGVLTALWRRRRLQRAAAARNGSGGQH